MAGNSVTDHDRTFNNKRILTGAAFGGLLGALVGYLHNIGVLAIEVGDVFNASAGEILIRTTILGLVIGAIVSSMVARTESNFDPTVSDEDSGHGLDAKNDLEATQDLKVPLREEKLDVSKEWVDTKGVTLHTETVEDEKTITVPISRKELVVEQSDGDETIRIPISEQRIEVTKHPVILKDVEVYKRQFQDIEHFEETLQQEQLKVNRTGKTKAEITREEP